MCIRDSPYIVARDVRILAAAENGKIFAPGNPFNNFKVNADGTLSPFNNGTPVGTAGIGIGGDGYRIPDKNHTISPYKTYQGFARLSYELVDGIEWHAQAIVSRSDLKYEPLANSLVQGNPTLTIYQGNPFIPAALAATLPPGGSFGFNAYFGSSQQTKVKERTDFWQLTTGVDAELGDGWKASLSYTHGRSQHDMDQSGLWDWRKTLAAVDVVLVNGVPTCRVLTLPQFAAAYAGCKPINLFRGAPINSSPEGYAYATGTSSYRARFNHDSIVGTVSGSLFELPAGQVDVVIGAEYRHQSLNLSSNADPALLDTAAERNAYFAGVADRGLLGSMLFYWLTNVGSAKGEISVKEVFGELAIPLVKESFFEELSINGAARYTDYSTSGSVTTWKLGATWKPVRDILFRGTVSRDIRAPNLYELFRGDQSGIGIVLDPVTGLNQNVPTVSGGNPNLKPEVAKTLTLGAVISPSFLPGFSFSIDYYRIRLKGAIDSLSSQQILNNCASFGPNTPECLLITRPSPNAFPTLVRISEANISFLRTAGWDFDLSYRTNVGNNGALAIRLYANYLSQFTTQQFVGQPLVKYAGRNGVGSNPVAYPRLRGNLSLDYSVGPFGITWNQQYIGKMRHLNIAAPALSTFVDPGVGAVTYTDLSLRWNMKAGGGSLEFFGTINNLFDKDPPIIPGTVAGVNLPTNISTYDVIGRAFVGGVRFRF
ncbi:MAG: TonB-dependent receptor, partial [Alteraurantiacibacter sp.]|nr:TonB-dependent receptor [Alteraurantiacibacter sp.]